MLLHLILQIRKHSQKEIPLQKLVLVLHARTLNEFPDGAETLCDPVVVLNID